MSKDKQSEQTPTVQRPSTSTPNPSNFERKGAWPIGRSGETPSPSPNGDRGR